MIISIVVTTNVALARSGLGIKNISEDAENMMLATLSKT